MVMMNCCPEDHATLIMQGRGFLVHNGSDTREFIASILSSSGDVDDDGVTRCSTI